jgi:hypothetical protein
VDDRHRTAAEEVPSPPADYDQVYLLPVVVAQKLLRRLDQIGIEAASESFLGGHQDEHVVLVATPFQQRMVVIAGASRQASQHARHR